MVQEFHVLRCFSCQVFQVHQVKKANKWSCKVCGQKQSVLKVFGRGSGADCRRHVQKLNAARGTKMEDEAERRAKMDAQALWNDETEADEDERLSHKPVSRWDKYLPPPQEEAEHTQEGAEPEEGSVVLDRDVLQSSAQRVKRRAPPTGPERKRRRDAETREEFGPSYNTSPPRAVPRAAPTVPRAAPTVPRAASTVPRAASTVPRAASTVPRAAPTVPRAAPTVPRAAPTVPRAAPTVPRAALTVPRAASTVPRAAPTVPRAAPTVSRAAPTVSRAAPTVPRAASTVPRAASPSTAPPPGLPPPCAPTPRPVSKWSAFLEPPSASGSRISVSSMFQSGDDVDLDLDLDLDWV